MVGARALLAVAVGTAGLAGCSAERGAASAPPVSSPGIVASAPAPTPSAHPGRVVPRQAVVATHLARSVPVRLQIKAIGVNSGLMDLGLKADGTMQVPPRGFPAGWYTGAPTPGELGPAIIAGHVDMKGPGVFYDLHRLRAGDEVIITRRDGSNPVFRVTRVARFPKDAFPTRLVYGNIDHAGLRLITCGGLFNSQSGHYEDNIVAFADLVAPAR
jgi:hypothetical protein